MEQVVPNVSKLGDMRAAYLDKNNAFLESHLVSLEPMEQFKQWFDQIKKTPEIREPNAMCISTVNKDGCPSARFVLLKSFSNEGFKFFTNTQSRKGQDLQSNQNVALTFYWPPHHRQVRVEGVASELAEREAEEYFESRPRESQLSCAASNQSCVVPSRQELEQKTEQLSRLYAGLPTVPKPPHWGGYLVVPKVIEFWQGQSDRLHDRIVFRRARQGELADGVSTHEASEGWLYERLSP